MVGYPVEMMDNESQASLSQKIRKVIIGGERSLHDPHLFHKLSLIVFFAWVGLGVDGLTSSCYGPEESFLALGETHLSLAIFVAVFSAITIFVISASYSQIIELFPTGGGGYVVASKLLSPVVGMISGCALVVDYVLTITLSVASGADALFSFLPEGWHRYRLEFALLILAVLVLLNLRGVKESVLPIVPIFLVFLVTHALAIGYAFVSHAWDIGGVMGRTVQGVQQATQELGVFGALALVLRAYSMGAGTYTGIEAVSNGIPILREPKVRTARRTMQYMAGSLAFMVVGLTISYLLFRVQAAENKTLNAVLLETLSKNWNPTTAHVFVLTTLVSEAVLLFVAAQTGFLDGPRVLGNMALDRWVPTRFAILSDRLVTQNGILLMGAAAMILMIASRGSVRFMVVLYSINVFITFFLSQLGMVRHWLSVRDKFRAWWKKAIVNGIGLVLTTFILISVAVLKFHEGGWITLFITGSLVVVALWIRDSYRRSAASLGRLDKLVEVSNAQIERIRQKKPAPTSPTQPDPNAKTAVILVGGYNGLGLHTWGNVIRYFGTTFRNFVFVQVGVVDAGNFKGAEEIDRLKAWMDGQLDRYVELAHGEGFYAETESGIGTDAVDGIVTIVDKIRTRYPAAVFFGGQMVFPRDNIFDRLLHNYTTFAVQKRFYRQGIPFLIIPARVEEYGGP
jgi:amino acid transporter